MDRAELLAELTAEQFGPPPPRIPRRPARRPGPPPEPDTPDLQHQRRQILLAAFRPAPGDTA